MTRLLAVSFLFCLSLPLGGCIVGTAVSVAGDVAEGAVNTTGAVVGAVIPDGDDDKDD
ncbi:MULTISPECIES: NF038104 family lipoprotein [Henriciella]|jgi:hypothetical protein|uniref:Lipoprotein n=1 Tax=Henriciella pelagia TaxID=1977912 RepID=A0ABQ1JSY6_9PROT|nr:NF038104 family lipoprotein [Henriciella pelagia]GGB76495.1 hypothetical protein GCM10011503_26600 [Henriciella pelagia]